MDAIILQAIEKLRCGFLDVFFSIFTALGEEAVIAGIIAVIYICFDKRLGERALITVLTASCVTTGVKGAARRLRPYEAGVVSKVDVDNAFVSTADLDADMSFPSGHATATSGFFTTVSMEKKKPVVIVLCSVFTLLVVLSRMYLGVHYPTDVLAGLAVGIGTAFFWHFIYKDLYNARLYVYLGVALLAMIFLAFDKTATESMYQICALTPATAAGLILEENFIRFENTDKWWKRGVRLILMALVAAIPYLLLGLLPENILWFVFLRYFLTVFITITGVPFLIRIFHL